MLSQLGIPMSNAIGLFLRQIIMQRGVPFDVKLPPITPAAISGMSASALNAELEKDEFKFGEYKIIMEAPLSVSGKSVFYDR